MTTPDSSRPVDPTSLKGTTYGEDGTLTHPGADDMDRLMGTDDSADRMAIMSHFNKVVAKQLGKQGMPKNMISILRDQYLVEISKNPAEKAKILGRY